MATTDLSRSDLKLLPRTLAEGSITREKALPEEDDKPEIADLPRGLGFSSSSVKPFSYSCPADVSGGM